MKKILILSIAVLIILSGCGKKGATSSTSVPEESSSTQTDSVQQQDVSKESEKESGVSTEKSEVNEEDSIKAEESESSKESEEAVILENEGDIEIIVPDDQEFGGE